MTEVVEDMSLLSAGGILPAFAAVLPASSWSQYQAAGAAVRRGGAQHARYTGFPTGPARRRRGPRVLGHLLEYSPTRRKSVFAPWSKLAHKKRDRTPTIPGQGISLSACIQCEPKCGADWKSEERPRNFGSKNAPW